MRPRSLPGLTVLPIAIAIGATAAFGWWMKQQPETRGWRRVNYRLDNLPPVAVTVNSSGVGSPPRTRFVDAQAGAWLWLNVQDGGIPRVRPSDRVRGLIFRAYDEDGAEWTTHSYFRPGGYVVAIPRGYSRVPRQLRLQVYAQTRLIMEFPFPPLEPVRKELSGETEPDPKLTVSRPVSTVVLRRMGLPTDNFRLVLDHPPARDEMIRVAVAAHTFYRSRPWEYEWRRLGPGVSSTWLPSRSVNGLADIKSVELLVQRYVSHSVKRHLSLDQSRVRAVDGQALLIPRPSEFELEPGFIIRFKTPIKEMGLAGATTRTMFLSVDTDTPVRKLHAKVTHPREPFKAFNVNLVSIGGALGAEATFDNPMILQPVRVLPVPEGPYPVQLEVEAWPYRLVNERTVTVPVNP